MMPRPRESGPLRPKFPRPVHALEENSQKFRDAKSQDEKLRIYSELVKDNGAQMLGGQVGMTSVAWNLELKGDDNFPVSAAEPSSMPSASSWPRS